MKATFTYVIQAKSGKLYIGMTTDPMGRLRQHHRGECPTSWCPDCETYEHIALYRFYNSDNAHRFELVLQAKPEPVLLQYLIDNPDENTQVLSDIANYRHPYEDGIYTKRRTGPEATHRM